MAHATKTYSTKKPAARLDYAEKQAQDYATKFLGDFLDRPAIKQSGLEPLIKRCAEGVYFTTFTDDSGYVPGSLGFRAFKDQWESHPEKRKAIMEVLDYFQGSNWIVNLHIQDVAEEIGLTRRYSGKVAI